MRYHYETIEASTYSCDHPLYDKCTLYSKGENGLAVVQNRYSPKTKVSWLGPIDNELVYAICAKDGFNEYFEKNACAADENKLYFTVSVRTLMWALKMKPLKKNIWEKGL